MEIETSEEGSNQTTEKPEEAIPEEKEEIRLLKLRISELETQVKNNAESEKRLL